MGRPAATESPTVYDALTSPVRRAILDALTERDGQTLFELTTRLLAQGVTTGSRQAVTQHLDLLEAVGLVLVERRGRYRLHHLDVSGLREICARWHLHGSGGAEGPSSTPNV